MRLRNGVAEAASVPTMFRFECVAAISCLSTRGGRCESLPHGWLMELGGLTKRFRDGAGLARDPRLQLRLGGPEAVVSTFGSHVLLVATPPCRDS